MRTKLLAWGQSLALALALTSTPALSQSVSRASEASLAPIASLVAIPLSVAALSATVADSQPARELSALPATSMKLIVASVKPVADGSIVVMQSAGAGASFAVRLSGKVVQDAGLATGQAIEAVAMASGHVLIASGRVLAMLPNQQGQNLLYDERVTR